MLKICPCCKYVSNLYQTITFTSLLRINTYLANICICPHFSRQRKCNANLELQIYHIFAPFANISKSVFSSSVKRIESYNLILASNTFTQGNKGKKTDTWNGSGNAFLTQSLCMAMEWQRLNLFLLLLDDQDFLCTYWEKGINRPWPLQYQTQKKLRDSWHFTSKEK